MPSAVGASSRGPLLIGMLGTALILGVPAEPAHASGEHGPRGAEALRTAIAARAASFSGTAAVSVIDPERGRELYAQDLDEVFVAASLYKLGVLVEAERRVERGELAYADTVTITPEDITEDGSFEPAGTVLGIDEALERMITVSDNGTALALLRTFTPAAVERTLLEELGTARFHVAPTLAEDNTVTAQAVARLFARMAAGKLVSGGASARMRARLLRQTVNDRLPAQLPPEARVAHKTGNLAGLTHDAGIIYTARGTALVTVVLTANAGETEANELIAAIGSLVYHSDLAIDDQVTYSVPRQAIPGTTGGVALAPVRLLNTGTEQWADGTGVAWVMSDAGGRVIERAPAPLRLGDMPTGRALDLLIELPVPATVGRYRVELSLAGADAPAATAGFSLQAAAPLLVALEADVPPYLRRGEPVALAVSLEAMSELDHESEIGLGWRLLDRWTERALAQGTGSIGALRPHERMDAITVISVPLATGTYLWETFPVENGAAVGASQRVQVELGAPLTSSEQRSYGPW